MKVIKANKIGKHKSYDIGLEGPHNFLIKGGVFASNCFNKSHSVAYSYLTYVTAYIKANHPVEFFCALMTTRSKSLQPKDWAQKAPQYINEAKQMGVEINAPSVNASNLEFTIRENQIYFGLNAIRDVGKTAARSIMAARKTTPFKSVMDFVSRVNTQKVNIRTFVSLARAGAFDKMGYCRQELEDNAQEIYDFYKDIAEYQERLLQIKERETFNSVIIPKIERRNELRKAVSRETKLREKQKQKLSDMDFEKCKIELDELEEQKLKKKVTLKEKEMPEKPNVTRYNKIKINFKQILQQAVYIGCYLETHPVTLIKNKKYIEQLYAGEYGRVAGVVTNYKPIITKTKSKMAFLELDDSRIICEGVIFPAVYKRIESLNLKQGDLILADVKVQSTEPYKLIINKVNIYEG